MMRLSTADARHASRHHGVSLLGGALLATGLSILLWSVLWASLNAFI
jgi:hypothetical protein